MIKVDILHTDGHGLKRGGLIKKIKGGLPKKGRFLREIEKKLIVWS